MSFGFVYRLGLKFQDPIMENKYLEFRNLLQDKLFLWATSICCFGAIVQVPVDFAVGNNFLTIDIGLAVGSVLALGIRKRCSLIYKIFYSIYIWAIIYMSLINSIYTEVPYPVIYNFVAGNYLGIMEALLIVCYKNIIEKIVMTVAILGIKAYGLKDDLNLDDTTIYSLLLPIFSILTSISFDKLERDNYRLIYESRQKLEKFQILLSDDFPSNVLIVNVRLSSVLYSNNFFTQKFESVRHILNSSHKEFISSFFQLFKVESLLNPSLSRILDRDDTLFDFIKKVSVNSEIIQMNRVLVLSATFHNHEPQHYEIRLRKIEWEGEACYTIILNDISDKQLVTALKYADEQKDRVIATVSHELRTPINGILGLLKMAELQVQNTLVQVYLNHCKSCSKLLLYLVNSILDLSLLRQNKLHIVKNMFCLDELLEEMKSLYLFQSEEKGISFIIEKASNIPKQIYTDRFRLIEILINLLSNAFKFTFKGSVTLSVSVDPNDHEKLRYKVTDTGLGIKDEDKNKLFKMFGKIKQEDKNINSHGAGLGLTIANSLVKALNNDDEDEKIELQSEYKQGSTFTFRILATRSTFKTSISSLDDSESQSQNSCIFNLHELNSGEDPVYTKIETLTNRSSSRMLKLPSPFNSNFSKNSEKVDIPIVVPQNLTLNVKKCQSKNILIVDDNPFNLLTASFLLEKQGLNVTKANSGEECVRILQVGFKEERYYGLVLMDIQMPVQDGIETTKIIKAKIQSGELYDVPIVALTANKVRTNEMKEYKESGMIEALEKPLKERVIHKLIKKYFLFD